MDLETWQCSGEFSVCLDSSYVKQYSKWLNGHLCLVRVRSLGGLRAKTIESGGTVGFEWSYQKKRKLSFSFG